MVCRHSLPTGDGLKSPKPRPAGDFSLAAASVVLILRTPVRPRQAGAIGDRFESGGARTILKLAWRYSRADVSQKAAERVVPLSEPGDIFSLAEARPAEAQQYFEEVEAFILEFLPGAHVEHVGSTAVPGCIGKGDVDVVVRVGSGEFEAARSILDGRLPRSSRNDATERYAEYDYARREQVVSVHLVAVDGTHDVFHQFKTLLLTQPGLVAQYNSLKRVWDGREMEGYRLAKAQFIESVLAGRQS
jgi:GrpB-like predicted nucleotidyltransferase (UPF0157 family)